MKYPVKPLHIVIGLIVAALVIIYFVGLPSNWSFKVDGFTDGGSGNNPKLTMYYVDWCPHCTSAKPDFQSVMGNGTATINGKTVDVAMVNPEKDPAAAAGKPVKGYPTILFEKPGGNIVEYSGERNKAGFLQFLNENV
uniref:Thioredoxin domain-containing protein n=1 Tax=viral metagenome TaxID=1070528 RepID=A0A6C0IAC1_9ZZZZ